MLVNIKILIYAHQFEDAKSDFLTKSLQAILSMIVR